jgi:ADP-ribose pyrophosphatase YjhB (NUDIX family)
VPLASSLSQPAFYKDNLKMHVATDSIVFGFDAGKLKLLLFKRQVDPFRGSFSLIGSFVSIDEDIDTAARRVLKNLTGLENIFLEQVKTFGKADRDPGGRCVSVAQYALIRINDENKKLVGKHGAFWYNLDELPPLVLDHNEMVELALETLRYKAKHQPLGFELLPRKFTLPQLQLFYEAIYQRRLDPRNFRKKVLSLQVLTKLNEKDKSTSKRGAFLYKFNQKKYEKLLSSGFDFQI